MATATLLWQPAIPDAYTHASVEELSGRIAARRAELAGEVVILGHHYQRDDVIAHADFTGDSFKLSQLAAERVEEVGAKTVVFCGVHFMAETADVLTNDGVAVLLPDMGAGCSMADMADYDQTVDAWEQCTSLFERAGRKVRLIPICYMNSSAAIKAFCGEHGGAVCTSSNCDKVFRWAIAGGDEPLAPGEEVKILFIPDQHLGRNTAADAGFRPDRPLDAGGEPPADSQMCVWDPRTREELGGNTERQLLDSTFLLWKGHCSVHKLFRAEHVDEVRASGPMSRSSRTLSARTRSAAPPTSPAARRESSRRSRMPSPARAGRSPPRPTSSTGSPRTAPNAASTCGCSPRASACVRPWSASTRHTCAGCSMNSPPAASSTASRSTPTRSGGR